MKTLIKNIKEILKYPSAIAGLFIIFLLFMTAVYAMATIPYQKAIRLWRGGEEIWYANPKYAPPAWTNFFSKDRNLTCGILIF